MPSITRYKYYYFKKVLSPSFCDKVIQHGKSLTSEIAQTGHKSFELKTQGQKKKQKEVGKKIEEGFKKQDKEKKTRDLRMGGSKYLRGGGISQRGLGRAFMKGGRVR